MEPHVSIVQTAFRNNDVATAQLQTKQCGRAGVRDPLEKEK